LALESAGTLDCCCEHAFQNLDSSDSWGGRRHDDNQTQEVPMDAVVERVAGLDVHKKTVMAAVRTAGQGGRRWQEVREFTTYTEGLLALREWLVSEEVTPGGDGGHRRLLEAGVARLGG
jgi:hypothetical protein